MSCQRWNSCSCTCTLTRVCICMACCSTYIGANYRQSFVAHGQKHILATSRESDNQLMERGANPAVPFAGIIAERGFHFEGHLAESHGDALKASANAKALANALLVCLVVPWTLCVIAYTGEAAVGLHPTTLSFNGSRWPAL